MVVSASDTVAAIAAPSTPSQGIRTRNSDQSQCDICGDDGDVDAFMAGQLQDRRRRTARGLDGRSDREHDQHRVLLGEMRPEQVEEIGAADPDHGEACDHAKCGHFRHELQRPLEFPVIFAEVERRKPARAERVQRGGKHGEDVGEA